MSTVSIWQQGEKHHSTFCDIAIVGGGILGTSTAYWLSEIASQKEVALIEAGRLAGGASGRNAGFVLQGASSDIIKDIERYGKEHALRLLDFTCTNRDLLFQEVDTAAVDLRPSGSLTLAGDREEAERLKKATDVLQREGVSCGYLSSERVAKEYQLIGYSGGLHLEAGAAVNPVKLVRHLAQNSNANIYVPCTMTGINTDSEIRIETSQNTIIADRAVLCLGAQIARWDRECAALVRPVRGQMLATSPIRSLLDPPVYSHGGYYYFRQLTSGRIIAGGARHLHEEAEAGFEDATTRELQRDIEHYLHRHLPDMSWNVDQRWSGTMSFSRDHLPVIGRFQRTKNLFWMGGCTGHGMAYGFHLGRVMANHLLGIDTPSLDLFHLSRFN